MTPDVEQLASRLKTIRLSSLAAIGYRSTTPKYANEADLLTGEGSRCFGGRWNPPGVAAVYASFSPETAMHEAIENCRRYGIPFHTVMPRVFVALKVQLSKVVDLTDGMNRKRLRVSEDRMLNCQWNYVSYGDALTQRIGRAASDSGVEAIVVRSAADSDGQNLVVFPENLLASSCLAVLDADRLTGGI